MCNSSVQNIYIYIFIYVGVYNGNGFEVCDLWYKYVPMTRERKKEKEKLLVPYGMASGTINGLLKMVDMKVRKPP